jgi:toxin ParE1/3/4
MEKYRVTPRAEEDLKSIGRYTQQHWGKTQRSTYLKNLENRFNWLAKSPAHGRHRTDIAEGYYSFPEGQQLGMARHQSRHRLGTDSPALPHQQKPLAFFGLLPRFLTHLPTLETRR